MITVVVGDLHHKIDWVNPFLKELKKEISYDEVVFVGDYFDDFSDSPEKSAETARWLRESLWMPDRIHCVGNHDLPYMLFVDPERTPYDCPGWEPKKDVAINEIMREEDWQKIRPCYYTQGWMISHAGFNFHLVACPVKGIPEPEKLVWEANRGLKYAREGTNHPFFLPGKRMCSPWVGGITWQDWNNEYIPIVGMPQIVGHTPHTFVSAKRVTKDQTDYNIDCGTTAVLIIEDGKVRIHRTGRNWKYK